MIQKPRKRVLSPLEPKEDAIHIQLVSWCKLALRPDVVFFHVPNGGLRTKREAAKFRAMGVLPGVLDLVFVADGHVYVLELKRSTGRLSEDQRAVISRLERAGAYTGVAYGFESATAMVKAWGLTQLKEQRPKAEPPGATSRQI
jgi:hypothetical protein